MLVGHSLGGLSALAVAALYPERVARVVSVGGYAQGVWTGVLGMYQGWARGGASGRMLFSLAGFVGLGIMFTVSERSRMRGKSGEAHAFDASPHWKTLFAATGQAGVRPHWGAMQKCFAAAADADIRDLLPGVPVPTLVMGGDDDWLVPPEQSRLLAQQIPGATLVVLPDVGHYPMLENTDAYNRAVAEWLHASDERIQPVEAAV
jgi:pimeloyl-ACP methyl ester carboxylesterase